MVFPDFDPVVHIGSFALQWGPFAIRWYALAYVAGILLAWWYGLRLIRTERLWSPAAPPPIQKGQIDDLVLWSTLGVIVGGRLGSVLFYNTEILWTQPLTVFKIWEGGMSFHGGFIGVVLASYFYARSKGIDPLRLGDMVAPCVPFGLFFGRIANFINGELWGRPTDLPWGFVVQPGGPALHPSQLYEAALEGVILFGILWLATHRFGQLKRRGALTGLFMLCYGVFRILVEQVRAPDAGLENLPLGLTMGTVLSLPMAMVGLWLVMRARKEGDVTALAAAAGAPAIEAAAVKTAEAPKAKAQPAPQPKAASKAPAKAAPKAKAALKPAAKAKAAPASAPTKAAPKPAARTTAAKPKAPAKPKPKPRTTPKS